MSNITNIMVTGLNYCSPEEFRGIPMVLPCGSFIRYINTWFKMSNLPELKEISQYASGPRCMETFVWAGAYNYLCEENFRQFIIHLKDELINNRAKKKIRKRLFGRGTDYVMDIQVFMQTQEEDKFTEIGAEGE